jgi:hypothetical protein
LHPAAIFAHPPHPEPDHSIKGMRTTAPANATPGLRSPPRFAGSRFSLVDAIANRMIIAAVCDCRRGVPAAAAN